MADARANLEGVYATHDRSGTYCCYGLPCGNPNRVRKAINFGVGIYNALVRQVNRDEKISEALSNPEPLPIRIPMSPSQKEWVKFLESLKIA